MYEKNNTKAGRKINAKGTRRKKNIEVGLSFLKNLR